MLCAVCKLGPWSHLFLVFFCWFGSVWFRMSRSHIQNDNNFFSLLFSLCIYSLPNVNKMQIKYTFTQWSCAFLVSCLPSALSLTISHLFSPALFLVVQIFLFLLHLCFSSIILYTYNTHTFIFIYLMRMCKHMRALASISVCAFSFLRNFFLFIDRTRCVVVVCVYVLVYNVNVTWFMCK